jgi:transposase
LRKNSNSRTAARGDSLRNCPAGSTVGLDIGDRWTHAAVIGPEGELYAEDRLASREPDVRRWLSRLPASVVAMEVGTHSRWMARVGRECGHRVLVANPRQLRLIYAGDNKTDRLDAEKLARLARVDWRLLKPVEHRPEQEQADLGRIGVREALVEMRTQGVNLVRGMVKAGGGRIAACSPEAFPETAQQIPEALRGALAPMLEQIQWLNERIREADEMIEHIARTQYPEVELLTQVSGVGWLTALAFRLTISDPRRFERSRDVGCYLGLRPKRDQSGEQDPQLGITKAGNERLRRLLVNCAHYILGPFGPDSDLRRWGLKLAGQSRARGAKPRAVVAVARKLAVLLHRLWVGGEAYEPLRNSAGPAAGMVAGMVAGTA